MRNDEIRNKTFRKLGLHIQKLRALKNISFEELSKLSGINKKYLKRIEDGEAYGINPRHLTLLCKGFDITLPELLKFDS